MKRFFTMMIFVISSITVWSQESQFTLSGGYAFTNIEESDAKATGWRINGTYEFNKSEGRFSHGISFGYIGTKATATNALQTNNYKLNSWPVYYAPKVMFGKNKFRGFLKGALGMHFSNYKKTGSLAEVKVNGGGFYGGAAAGVMFFLKENIVLNLEYEWAYLSNTSYHDGFMNSAMLGLGFRF
jgi:hypothetical protein